MNDSNSEKNRFELEKKQHESDLQSFTITNDLAAQLDRLHEALQLLLVEYKTLENTYKPHLKDF